MPRVQNTTRPELKWPNKDADVGGRGGWEDGDEVTAERFLCSVYFL